MEKANNFIPELYVNQFKNYYRSLKETPDESFLFNKLSEEIKLFLEHRIQLKEKIYEFAFHDQMNLFNNKERIKYKLFNINIRFYIFEKTLRIIAEELELNQKQEIELIDYSFIENKNNIDFNTINNLQDKTKRIYTSFVDYIFLSLILMTQKNKYKESDFEEFIRNFKDLLKDSELNITFRFILEKFFNFIDQFFIKKEFNDTINFSKDDRIQNLHLMKEYNDYFNNSVRNTIDFFETIQFSDTMIDFFEKFNSDEKIFIDLLKNTLDKYEDLLINLVDDNNNDDNNKEFSSTYKKSVAQILSPKEHYLTFIYNMNISKINNKKCFPLLSNALRDGIFFDTLFSVFLKKHRKEKLNDFSKNNKINVFTIINSMNKDYDSRFNHLTTLFISHYLGLSMNQSYNLADNLNIITNENIAFEKTIHKKTYQKYYKKTKKHILNLKHEIGNLINID